MGIWHGGCEGYSDSVHWWGGEVKGGKGEGAEGQRGESRRLGAVGVGGLPGAAWARWDGSGCWVPAPDRVRGRLFAGMTVWLLLGLPFDRLRAGSPGTPE